MVETDKLFGTVANKLLEAAVDKLLVAAVDKLEFDILAVDRLVAVLLAVIDVKDSLSVLEKCQYEKNLEKKKEFENQQRQANQQKSESELNPNSNSTDDDNDNSNSTDNDNNDSNSTSNTEQYIMLLNLTIEQELIQFSDNNENIMSEHAHNTDARFEHEYSGQTTIVKNPSYV
ncbi:hypothetical protein G9A89_014441 [Geosiphon pyriformis]|nr:hypothetical protein G9A89_014441 [Geosiphon pyriformis]